MESSLDSQSFAVCVSLHSVPRSNSNELRTPLFGCTCVSSSSSIEKAPADSKRRAVRTPFLLFIRTLAGFRIIQTAASFSNRQRRASASASQPCTQPGADSPRADSVPHTPRCGPAPITPDPSPGFVALLEATSKSRVACAGGSGTRNCPRCARCDSGRLAHLESPVPLGDLLRLRRQFPVGQFQFCAPLFMEDSDPTFKTDPSSRAIRARALA